ncbi:hypothetical protein ACEQPO_17795 [Bacillus sp. SL00103]
MLSAKDFGFTEVTHSTAGTDQVGPYELEEPIGCRLCRIQLS